MFPRAQSYNMQLRCALEGVPQLKKNDIDAGRITSRNQRRCQRTGGTREDRFT